MTKIQDTVNWSKHEDDFTQISQLKRACTKMYKAFQKAILSSFVSLVSLKKFDHFLIMLFHNHQFAETQTITIFSQSVSIFHF
ncbi:hypothetical protein C6370_15445 [Bacillus atrophaeus]|nr:hypothetical protein C6370_15445 [Bacillus atrophaeus]